MRLALLASSAKHIAPGTSASLLHWDVGFGFRVSGISGSSRKVLFSGPCCKGAVLYLGPKQGP